MKVTFDQPAALAGAVKFAARALSARPAYPVLAGIKIEAHGGETVHVSAFDYETSARAEVPAEVGEPGTVLVPGRLAADITGRLPRQPVSLAGDATGRLTLECGSLRYRLHGLRLDEYPDLPALPEPAGHASPGEFTAAVRQVAIAASRDDTLPALGAVQATFTPDALILAATDRYRAAIARLPWQPAGGTLPPPALIPAPALAEAARTASDREPVAVHVLTGPDGAPAAAGFGCGPRTLTTRLTVGDYPGIAALIPSQFTATVTTGSADLAEAVKRLTVVAAHETPIRLAITPGQIELAAGAGDDADGADTVACDLDGDPVSIAFHPRRLLDAITATGADQTRIALTGPARLALFTPAGDGDGGDPAEPGYRHLLMPIRTAG